MPAKPGSGLAPRHWIGFVALTLLWASAWLVDGAFPSALPASGRQALRDLIISTVLGAFGWKRLLRVGTPIRHRAQIALASIMLLGLPSLLTGLAQRGVSQVTEVALFAMLPVLLLVLAPILSRGISGASGLLPSALIGLTGILLILPFGVPRSGRQAGLAIVVLIGVTTAAAASLWLHSLLAGISVLEAATIFALANGVFFAILFALSRRPWSWVGLPTDAGVAILFELPQLLLLIWLMRDLLPERFAARYLVVPLWTIMEGLVVLHGDIVVRTVVGMVLAALGAWRLLTAPEVDEEPSLMLR